MRCRARYSISDDLKWGELLLLKSRLQKGLLVSQATTKEERDKRKEYKGFSGLYSSFQVLCSALRRCKEKVVMKFAPNQDRTGDIQTHQTYKTSLSRP